MENTLFAGIIIFNYILSDFFCMATVRLLQSKNVENQTLESLSAAVQKRFNKNNYLSGNSQCLSNWNQLCLLLNFLWIFSFSWHFTNGPNSSRRFNKYYAKDMRLLCYARFIPR